MDSLLTAITRCAMLVDTNEILLNKDSSYGK